MALINTMRQNIHYFSGRGLGAYDSEAKFLSCIEGTVFAIIHTSHGVDFIYAYCREAYIDRWELQCVDPFVRCSDSTLKESCAVSMGRDQFIYKPSKLKLVAEQDWMRRQIF